MKILVYGINYAPEPVGVGKFNDDLARWLAKRGASVRVVAAQPSYPAWRALPGFTAWAYSRETRDGVDIRRCPVLLTGPRAGLLGRMLFLLSFVLSSIPQLLNAMWWRPDAVVCVQPAMLAAPQGFLAARLCGAVAWLHVQDMELDLGTRLGFALARRLYTLARRGEAWLLRSFDEVSTICPSMAEELGRRGGGRAIRLLPNWADDEAFAGPEGTAEGMASLRASLRLPEGCVVALFSGSMGRKHDLEAVLRAARRLEDENIVVVLCGDGPQRPKIARQSAGMPNVRLLPLQDRRRLHDLLALAAVHLVPQRAEAQGLALPSKLANIQAHGGVALATARPRSALARAVLAAGGLTVPPGDDLALARAVRAVARDPALRSRRAALAREYACAQCSKDAILSGLLTRLTWLAEQRWAKAAQSDAVADHI